MNKLDCQTRSCSNSSLEYFSADDAKGDMLQIDAFESDERLECLASSSSEDSDALINYLENTLEHYEKISLLFLVNEDNNFTLQELILLLRGASKQVISDWFRVDSNGLEKLKEALTLIQNYRALKKLDINKTDANAIYLPLQIELYKHVRPYRKVLYRICEDLPTDLKLQLLMKIRSDIALPGYEIEYFEMYFIYLESVGYLEKLAQIFKVMEIDKYYEILKKCSFKSNLPERAITSSIQTRSAERNNNQSNVRQATVEIKNDYAVDPQHPGVCLIINNENFYSDINEFPDIKLQTRQGTEFDKIAITRIFNEMKFRVIQKDDLTSEEILDTVTSVLDSVTVDSSAFLFILSHGISQKIYGVNSKAVEIADIHHKLQTRNVANLNGKPKILLIQACQGEMCQKLEYSTRNNEENYQLDGPSRNVELTPKASDICTVYATVQGYSAIRSTQNGSWFIQSLCDNIKKYAKTEHFADICTAMIHDCSQKIWSYKKNEYRVMTPQFGTTLRKKLWLPAISK